MAWTVEIERRAEKELGKLAKQDGKRIVAAMRAVAALENPRDRGKAMAGEWAGHWRYRIGDYRIIARIEDGRMVIVVVALGHRREVYR
ncbi:MAG: type II toxin-antitoxin system RelE/ParE family toxin [Sphingopyxis sp.]